MILNNGFSLDVEQDTDLLSRDKYLIKLSYFVFITSISKYMLAFI